MMSGNPFAECCFSFFVCLGLIHSSKQCVDVHPSPGLELGVGVR